MPNVATQKPKLKKPRWKVSVGTETAERLGKIAERFDMTGPTLAAFMLSELSYVRPEGFFEALGAIPKDLKARPVGRPAGSTTKADATTQLRQAAS